MNREEAMYLLNNLRSVAEGKEDEAIDMAIEVLQAQTDGDLIRRSDAIAEIKALYEWHDTVTEDRAVDHLKRLPSAEPKTGEWIDYVGKDLGIEGQWLRDDGKTVFVQCDQCDSIFVRNLMTHMNFCPNCGARMRGEEE